MMSFIGPALPPHLKNKEDEINHDNSVGCNDSDKVESQEITKEKDDGCDVYGPALPPGMQKVSSIGPALPPGLRERLSRQESEDDACGNIGSGSEDDGDAMVGPMPLPSDSDGSYAARLIEERSQRMQQKLLGKGSANAPKKREEWMLELPEGRTRQAMLGMNLAPRTFQTRPAPKLNAAGRSAWTDTPADKERKKATKRDGGDSDDARKDDDDDDDSDDEDDDFLEREAVMQRDKKMEEITEQHNSLTRKESLLDMHLKKQKKEAKKKRKKEKKRRKETGKEEREERRPFDRDVDLQANRFDEAQKAAILKKAQLLDDRFSRGRQKFL